MTEVHNQYASALNWDGKVSTKLLLHMTLDFLKGGTLLFFFASGNVGIKIWFSIILNFKFNYLGLYYGLLYILYLLDLRLDVSFLKNLKCIWNFGLL